MPDDEPGDRSRGLSGGSGRADSPAPEDAVSSGVVSGDAGSQDEVPERVVAGGAAGAETAVPEHDSTGLQLARAAASALRGVSRRRPRLSTRSSHHSRSTELSGSHPDGRDPALIGAEVEKLVIESGWSTDVAVHGVFARWAAIVGAEVATHCTPQTYQDGRLTVRTDSTAWATQLRLLAPTVVRRMNEELGAGTVALIDIVGPDGPTWSTGRRSVRGGRGPRDTYG